MGWLLLIGLGLVASSGDDGGGGGAGGAVDGGIDKTIKLTCDQAVDLLPLPDAMRAGIADAIAFGNVKAALLTSAEYLEDMEAAGHFDERVTAAFVIAAHCLRVRADSLPAGDSSIFAPVAVATPEYTATGTAGARYSARAA